MKLADSLNPATQAENIKKLNAGLEAVDAKTLPGTSTATTGQILKLTGENKTPSWADEYSYTPPAYSETETATGQKWIDGKDIYSLVLTKNIEELTTNANILVNTITSNLNVINAKLIMKTATNIEFYSTPFMASYSKSNGQVVIQNVTTTFSNGSCIVILYYTKPDSTPGRAPEDQEPEEVTPEEKKTTKKKNHKIKED